MPKELKPTTSLLPIELLDRIRESADRNHRSVSQEIRHILVQHLADQEDFEKEAVTA